MDSNSQASNAPLSTRTLAKPVFLWLSGLGLATSLLLLLGLLTWLATLEQIDQGLHATLQKYFHWKSVFLLPEINGTVIPFPLPSGYWVGALLLINLTLGGVIRIRKGWKHVGNIIAHFGIIFMLIAGGAAHHFSERGNMAIPEGETRDVAEDYFEYVVEVTETHEQKAKNIHVIRGAQIQDLTDGKSRIFRLPHLPFDIKIVDYQTHSIPVAVSEKAPISSVLVCDQYYLAPISKNTNAEADTAACYAQIIYRNGQTSPYFILAGASFHPFTINHENQIFTIDMRKRLWPMPFAVRLDHFTAKFHPGTMKPAGFISEVTRIEHQHEAKVTIKMNEPMRYKGLTFFQANYGPQGAKPGQKMYSVFEVVENPTDHWPEYSLYVVTIGMLITFLTHLGCYIAQSNLRTKKP